MRSLLDLMLNLLLKRSTWTAAFQQKPSFYSARTNLTWAGGLYVGLNVGALMISRFPARWALLYSGMYEVFSIKTGSMSRSKRFLSSGLMFLPVVGPR